MATQKRSTAGRAVAKREQSVPAAPTPMSIMQIAVQGGADIAQLEKLMDLQERWEAREAKKAYDEALAGFKSEGIVVSKNAKVGYEHKQGGGSTSYAYAPLHNILDEINPKLSKYGLSLTWRTEQDNGSIRVTAVLAHKAGHSESTSLHAAPDSSGRKNPVQAVGSTISYLERYTALAITGCTTAEMDDDGQGADNLQPKGFEKSENPAPPDQGTGDVPDYQRPDPQEEKREAFLKACMHHADKYYDQGLDAIVAMKDSDSYKKALGSLDPKRQEQLKKHVANLENDLMKDGGK